MSIKFSAKFDTEKAQAIIDTQGEKAVRAACNMLLDEARKQVPIETGTLQRSGAVDSHGKSGSVSFDTPYAIVQHENTKFHHDRGRKAKYLEDPCNDPAVKARILNFMKDNFDL